MFDSFRNRFKGASAQPAMAAAATRVTIPLIPSKLGGYTDPALEPKLGLGTRILQGLPGFVGQTATIMGAKFATTSFLSSSLMAGVAPVALTPLITGAGALAAGLAVAQSFKYARERMETLSKEQGRTITLRTIYNERSFAGAARELDLFRKEAFSLKFMKKAVVNGKWGVALGVGLGVADHTDLGKEVLSVAKEKAGSVLQLAGEKTVNMALAAKEKTLDFASSAKKQIQSGLASVNWKNPIQRLSEMVSGKALADAPKPSASAQLAQAADTKPATQLSHPLEQVSVEPPTPLEKVRILMDVKGVTGNDAFEKLLARAEEGKTNGIRMQAIKDLAVSELPLSKELRMDLLKIAAEGKNPQAIRDLAILTKGTVSVAATAPAGVDVATKAPAKFFPSGITEDSRARAMDFVRQAAGSTETPVQPAAAPKVDVPQPTAQAPQAPEASSEPVDPKADSRARAMEYVQKQGLSNGDLNAARQFAHDYALDKAPAPIADEAGRCTSAVVDTKKGVINTLCGIFKNMVTPNDHVLMQSSDQAISAKYSPSAEQPTQKFVDEARRHFRDNDLLPAYGLAGR